jgi:methylmalonyl-CoA mutase
MSDKQAANLKLLEEFPPVSDEAWRQVVEADLKGADFDKKLVWRTYEGLAVQPYYRAGALEGLDYLDSAPGEAPWHRGQSAQGNSWTILQEITLRDVSAANHAAREALEGGADAVSFVSEPFDGRLFGVNLQNVEQMRTLIRDLSIYRAGIHFRGKRFALPLLGNFTAALKASKGDPADTQGSIDYDPLSLLIQEGGIAGSREEMFFELSRVLQSCAAEIPDFRVLTVRGDQYHEAGGSAIQEIAFVLASLTEYLQGLKERGTPLDMVLPRLQVQFAVGSTYFMEIAKLRAARLLISRVLDAFLGAEGSAPAIPLLVRGASFNKSIYDAHNNLLRLTTEAMAAAIGGASAITLPAFDSSYKTPDSTSLRLSRNIQLLLKHEAYLDKVADPAAGSYLLETLTDSLAREAWVLFQKVEGVGGFLAAAANGMLREEVARVGRKKIEAIASRRHVMVGVNQYPNLQETALQRVDCESTVSELDVHRHSFKAEGESVLQALRDGFLEGATLSDALAALEKSESLVVQPIEPVRGAARYEAIRLRTERYAAKHGAAPTVFLLKAGKVAMRQARGSFIANFFGCGGFNIVDNLGFTSVEGGVVAAAEAKADIVVLCSSDEEYPDLAREACPLLKARLPKCHVIVAGYPKDLLDDLKQAGVDDFVHVRSVAEEVLADYQVKLGLARKAEE